MFHDTSASVKAPSDAGLTTREIATTVLASTTDGESADSRSIRRSGP
jgi:hypothetical protein